jgi:hypothetical protein
MAVDERQVVVSELPLHPDTVAGRQCAVLFRHGLGRPTSCRVLQALCTLRSFCVGNLAG